MTNIRKTKYEQLLLLDIIAEQRETGLSDKAFAQKISDKSGVTISRQSWQNIRTGNQSIPLDLLKAIMRTYKYRFDAKVCAYLRNENGSL